MPSALSLRGRCGVNTDAAIFALPQKINFFDGLNVAGVVDDEIKASQLNKLPKVQCRFIVLLAVFPTLRNVLLPLLRVLSLRACI